MPSRRLVVSDYAVARPARIVSGGQTGADRAALETAERCGIATGGFVPRGWLTEAGPDPELGTRFGLVETASDAYAERTERNLLASDATVVFGDLTLGGTRLTVELCRRHGRPVLLVPDHEPTTEAAARLSHWLAATAVRTLNVAGNRASENPGIGARVAEILRGALAAPR